MQSILKEFEMGNIRPDDGYIKKGSRYDRIIEIMSGCEKKLLENLDGELKDAVTQLINSQMEALSISCTHKFIYGYRLGVLMTMEVFNGSEDAIYGRKD